MESLLDFQLELFERICKAKTNFKKSPKARITKQYLEGRLELVDQMWFEFSAGHKDLKRKIDKKILIATEYVRDEIYDKTEECYVDYKAELKIALESFNIVEASCSSTNLVDQANVKSSHIRLPKINIPNFSGKYSEWSAFRDLYTALVHSNLELSKVQKLHYLKSYLEGEAEQYLRHVPIANENYDRCWQLLEERYNNKKYICHLTLKRLFSQKNLINESAACLKDLIDTTNDCLAALGNIGVEVGSWDVIIIHILCLKLDPETKRQWEFNVSSNSSADELPTYAKFKEFLTNRYRAMEFLDSGSNSVRRASSYNNPPVNKLKSLHVSNYQCLFCSGAHTLAFCKDFSRETVDVRRKFVETNNACYNCLGSNHSAKWCRTNVRCRVCKKKHHSLLHPNGKSTSETIEVRENSMPVEAVASTSKDMAHAISGPQQQSSVSCFSSGKVYNQALLATALVGVKSKTGYDTVRALLDQGSQSSFVTESTVQRLGLKKTSVLGQISGLGEQESISKAVVLLELQSRIDSRFKIKVEAYVLKSITAPLPTCKVDPSKWVELKGLVLADPEYHTPSRIDVLLGVGVYNQILMEGIERSSEGALLAQATTFGWILSGHTKAAAKPVHNINVLHCRTDDNMLLKRFWELEAEPEINKEKLYTEEEKRCEEIFAATTVRDEEGRYVVQLPLKNDPPQVIDSLKISEKRFYLLEKKLSKNKYLKDKYSEAMQEYINNNHIELVPIEERDDSSAIYLPHHAVIREDKDTTKVRVVFDASCKGKDDNSLNDNLMVGPTLQPELRHLVMRWRIPPICLNADITKMYLQVKIAPWHVDFQRMLWRRDCGTEIEHYRMSRVMFGTASAPYLAVKVLQQLANDEGASCPRAAERILNDYYMDDLLTGCETKEEGLRIFQEMNYLLGKGGFEIVKWTSNSEELVEAMGKEKGFGDIKKGLKIKSDEIIKIVGLTWNRSDDAFRYDVNLPKLEQPVTKRKIISDISRFYDPLGWVGPSIIKSKIIIQKLWLVGIEWDERVPEQILNEWLAYREELKKLEKITIPRWVGTKRRDVVELHGFCDASKVAYAAAVYIRVIDSTGKIHVSLLTAKTKVAPVKQVSIPRLELCGAVLLTRLMLETSKVLGIEKGNMRAWTDSTVVLAWINSHPSRWKVFVANRVSEIQTNLDSHNWSHVSTKENAADSASRGLSPGELVDNKMWFTGPDFLRNKIIRYEKPKGIVTDLEMVKVHCSVVEDSIWERFSSLIKMQRVVAYCVRFLNNLRVRSNERKKGYLKTQELKQALNLCIKQYQAIYFKDEIYLVEHKSNLPKRSVLYSLNPMLDDDQILRVGGRLEHSGLSREQKHPIVLPKKCHLAKLIVTDAHKQTLHGGPQLMMCFIQAKYFILGLKQLVRFHFRRCVICARNSANLQTQLMGQLPVPRVTPTRPFKCSGVDYAGPIQLRTAKGRGHKSYKGYICLFICMATKAIHLEAVTDLSTQGFLQAFKRFVSRRGHCSDIWSDNATNFTGAAAELKRLFRTEKGSMLQEVAEAVASNDCNWHFIPASSPNFGGLWEAGVKSVKYHLKRIIGQTTLTYEEISTVLAQVEACLNSRPLSVIAGNSDENIILTPGHFLVGEPIVTLPDANYESQKVSSLRRWQYMQKMLQHFWQKWSQEYLTKFLHRYKWASQQIQPKVGDVVLVKEDGLPPCRWLYGRVIATHPGQDNLVRVLTLKTKAGTFKRPISKVCLLPMATEEEI